MNLTRTERWIISNQLRILELIGPAETSKSVPVDFSKDDLRHAREAIEQGFELEYKEICEHIYADTMSEARCQEVLDILTMFDEMQVSFRNLEDNSGINPSDIEFCGWWANHEYRELSFARHFCEGRQRFTGLGIRAWRDSHCPMMGRYQTMLSLFRSFEQQYNLTKEQIMSLIRAGDNSSSWKSRSML